MRLFPTAAIIVFAVCTSIVGSQCVWLIDDQIKATNAWMMCDAIAKVLFVGAFWSDTKDKVKKQILFAVFLLAINNLLDELFFDPLTHGWNEVVIFILIMIHLIRAVVYDKSGK